MRDLANKMAELKFEAPLAQFEETEEWGPVDFQSATASRQLKAALNDSLNLNLKEAEHHSSLLLLEEAFKETGLEGCIGGGGGGGQKFAGDSPNQNSAAAAAEAAAAATGNGGSGAGGGAAGARGVDNFTEAFGGSLEDLVNTFDEKITKCFGNYETSVEELAPVQVRSQEEIMNECQMWWTITGNFGNILPIDWTKSYARQMHMPALQLGNNGGHGANGAASRNGANGQTAMSNGSDSSEEDEAVANDLDMHALILGGMQHMDTEQPIQTVEEVIKEIDDLMDETTPSDCDGNENRGLVGHLEKSEAMEKAKEVLGAPLYAEKLQSLKTSQLNELYLEMEVLIREFSETLIAELALRDELEYEKELKNSFISLLLGVQNKRRQFHVQKKRGKAAMLAMASGNNKSAQMQPSGLDPKYLTTVIPYHLDNGPPDNQALQVLIKILKAINEDSPTVPTLLTDYILKVLCPT